MRVEIAVDDQVRAAFARYLGRDVGDSEIRGRLADVMQSYLTDVVGVDAVFQIDKLTTKVRT